MEADHDPLLGDLQVEERGFGRRIGWGKMVSSSRPVASPGSVETADTSAAPSATTNDQRSGPSTNRAAVTVGDDVAGLGPIGSGADPGDLGAGSQWYSTVDSCGKPVRPTSPGRPARRRPPAPRARRRASDRSGGCCSKMACPWRCRELVIGTPFDMIRRVPSDYTEAPSDEATPMTDNSTPPRPTCAPMPGATAAAARGRRRGVPRPRRERLDRRHRPPVRCRHRHAVPPLPDPGGPDPGAGRRRPRAARRARRRAALRPATPPPSRDGWPSSCATTSRTAAWPSPASPRSASRHRSAPPATACTRRRGARAARPAARHHPGRHRSRRRHRPRRRHRLDHRTGPRRHPPSHAPASRRGRAPPTPILRRPGPRAGVVGDGGGARSGSDLT